MNKLNYFKTRLKLPEIDVSAYLARLELEIEKPSLHFLQKIHRAHLLKIPFENLDIHYGKKITFDIRSTFDKIVSCRRGGLCYELNNLIYHLLNQLGFSVYPIAARVFEQDHYSPEFDHLAVILEWEDLPYLVDVGFGKCFTLPKMISEKAQLDYVDYYKFDTDPDGRKVLLHSVDNNRFNPLYRFEMKPRELIEFLGRCQFHQEDPTSRFMQGKLITILTESGRITLTDRHLKILEKGVTNEYPVLDESEFLAHLEFHFGLDGRALIHQQSG